MTSSLSLIVCLRAALPSIAAWLNSLGIPPGIFRHRGKGEGRNNKETVHYGSHGSHPTDLESSRNVRLVASPPRAFRAIGSLSRPGRLPGCRAAHAVRPNGGSRVVAW